MQVTTLPLVQRRTITITPPMNTDADSNPEAGRSALADALATVGDRWTLLVVAALLDGPRRFGELQEEVRGIAQASIFFKSFQIHRAVDTEKNVLVYTVISTKLINGSPFNSISVVPVNAP